MALSQRHIDNLLGYKEYQVADMNLFQYLAVDSRGKRIVYADIDRNLNKNVKDSLVILCKTLKIAVTPKMKKQELLLLLTQ